MYFPIIRGSQYDLLALRELIEKNILSDKIVPIIEPVKISSTLISTIQSFVDTDREIGLIHNPSVGSFMDEVNETKNIKNFEQYRLLLANEKVTKAHILNRYSQMQLEKSEFNKEDLIVLHFNRDNQGIYLKAYGDTGLRPKWILVSDNEFFAKEVHGNKIVVEDSFNKQKRNADYMNLEDEFFSDQIFNCNKRGFRGFSDYTVIGEDFGAGGFAPYAVAIHMVYQGEEEIRIRHFVSDSNDDISNPAGKLYEAVSKLAEWWNLHQSTMTDGLQELLEHQRNGTYPGLGSVKKMSIKHHLELVGQMLK